jgi:hypothetical protein
MNIAVFCLLFSAALSKVHWTFFTSMPHNKEIVEAAASQQNHAEKLMHNI